jgi:hypothetical protein
MNTTTKSNKPKSPATPSRALGESFEDAKKLYTQYSHGKFAKAEIASRLGISATSGPFAARLFTLKEFGLVSQSGSDYTVSDTFMTLNSTNSSDAAFKQAALEAIRGSETFRQLLDDFRTKLPSIETVAGRLETQRKFNADPARQAARVLEKSLRYAGILDAANNILPVRDGAASGGGAQTRHSTTENNSRSSTDGANEVAEDSLAPDTLSMEIPVGEDRKVVIRYPRDLSSAEAKKVGNVLNAVVG